MARKDRAADETSGRTVSAQTGRGRCQRDEAPQSYA